MLWLRSVNFKYLIEDAQSLLQKTYMINFTQFNVELLIQVIRPWHISHEGFFHWQIDLKPEKMTFNSMRPRQNRRHFADDIFKPIFLNENIRISIKISLKFVPKVPINNIPALVQIMAWQAIMMVSLLTHICVTRPQWVNVIAMRPITGSDTCKTLEWFPFCSSKLNDTYFHRFWINSEYC